MPIQILDKMISGTDEWINGLKEDLGVDQRIAYRVLRAVLQSLRDQVEPERAVCIGNQLPVLVRGIYYENWIPELIPGKTQSRDDFFRNVERLCATDELDTTMCARAVFKRLSRCILENRTEEVGRLLPTWWDDLE